MQVFVFEIGVHNTHDVLTHIDAHIVDKLEDTHGTYQVILCHLIDNIYSFWKTEFFGKFFGLLNAVKGIAHKVTVAYKSGKVV
ncbi:MAG: hypothetical protein BWY70_00837 [Bacteroidetes bacterium ADurb.Bin408]|nr:MAG: hypothetical protein BWY70_00837 [Bacteroidetes bacterium ADurb.Bin408]